MKSKTHKNDLGFFEISQKPTQIELEQYYEKKYYQEGLGSYEINYSETELAYIHNKIFQKEYILKNLLELRSKKFLDIGCGEGFVMNHFHKLGCKVKGFDFSAEGIKKNNPNILNFFVQGNIFTLLDEEISKKNKYDIVWLQNVLEHVLDPVALMNSIRNIISDSGYLVVTVPNDFSKIQEHLLSFNKVDKPYWVSPPDHLSYFNIENIKNLFNITNWEIADLSGDFPIEWYLLNENSNYILDSSMGKSAHNARMIIENLISENDAELVRNLWASLAGLGMTRNITTFLKKV